MVGHWCAHIGAHNAPDAEILTFAKDHDYALLTYDLDFGAILAGTHGERPSVVQIRADNLGLEAIGKQVIDALRQIAAELDEGVLVTIEPNRTRIRAFPLRRK